MKTIRIGLIGLSMGYYATTYIREAVRYQGVEVIGICDCGRSQEYVKECAGISAEQLAAELKTPLFHEVDQLLRRQPDAVIVTSEICEHAEHVVASLEAGAHVFCAKPITVWVSHIEKIMQAAKKSDRVVLPGQPARYDDGFCNVVEIVHKGDIGNPVLLRVFVQHFAMHPKWCRDELRGGGAFSEFAYYCCDLILWVVQEMPIEVFGYGVNAKNPDMAFWDNTVMVFKFQHGVIAEATLSNIITYNYPWFDIEIIGTEGLARTFSHNYSYYVHSPTCCLTGPVRYSEMNLREIQHFLQCVRGVEAPRVTLDDARRVVIVLEALRESISTGRPIKI